MNLETAKLRIEIIVEALLAIDNYESFAKNHEDQWKHLIQQLIKNYYYIIKNTDLNDKIRKDAMKSIITLKTQNSSLTKIINHILNTTLINLSTNTKIERVQPNKLINEIKSYIYKIETNNFFDTETIESIHSDLHELKKQLIHQKSDFDETVYTELINLLEYHISKLNSTIASLEANKIKFKF